jgi:phosphatidylinositol glycan class B
VASFYGVNQWHYYLSQGIPILCTTALPFAIHGMSLMASSREPSARPRYNILLGVIAWTVAVYSLGQHKEWRFIHPLLPLMHVCAAKSLVDLCSGTDSKGKTKSKPGRTAARQPLPIRRSHLALLLLNLPLIPYALLVHGRAQIAVMRHLRTLPPSELDSVGFLMPCHSTPWQSHLHRPELVTPGRMWALGCEPPLGYVSQRDRRPPADAHVPGSRDPQGYEDQTDVFYQDPTAYLATYFPASVHPSFPPSPYPVTIPGSMPPSAIRSTEGPAYPWRHEWPRFLVFFSALLTEPGVKATLTHAGYTRIWRTWNGFEEDERRRGGVEVWKWNAPDAEVKQVGV